MDSAVKEGAGFILPIVKKNNSVGLREFEHSGTWQAYMVLPVCGKEVGTESLVSEVAKWNKFNFEFYSLLTSTKIDSRTAVLWTRTYRVAAFHFVTFLCE